MHRNISINTLCFDAGPLDAHVDAVVRLGARGISPDLMQIDECGASSAAALIRDAGLDVATLTHRSFAFASPTEVGPARERLERTIDIAAKIGAQSVIMTTGGRGMLAWPEAADRFAEAVAPCAALAREAGIALGIEQTSHLYADASIAHRLSDSLRIADQAAISLIIDLFACWFDADIDEAIAAAAPHTALVQVSDYVYGDRGLPCRAVPGDGAIPLERLLPAIVHGGFRGYFDLEILGPRLQAEGVEIGLGRAGSIVGKLLDAAGLPSG
jgi:sugar phosphate isomerase/epimerase